MVNSMTGYAALDLTAEGWARAWELRSVNGRGLDLRLRLPDRLTRLEPQLRARLKERLTRGSVTLGLRLTREGGSGGGQINPVGLAQTLDDLKTVEAAACGAGFAFVPPSAVDILGVPGVRQSEAGEVALPDDDSLLAEFDELLNQFLAARASEGAALKKTLTQQLNDADPLVARAAELAEARTTSAGERLAENMAKILGQTDAVDPDRLAQELAALAVKSDVTEEIDRLAKAHIPAARALLTANEPVGRRFDFLMQEFNREANTLCSKSGDGQLTQCGLDLKVLIDQMREQVQNVE